MVDIQPELPRPEVLGSQRNGDRVQIASEWVVQVWVASDLEQGSGG